MRRYQLHSRAPVPHRATKKDVFWSLCVMYWLARLRRAQCHGRKARWSSTPERGASSESQFLPSKLWQQPSPNTRPYHILYGDLNRQHTRQHVSHWVAHSAHASHGGVESQAEAQRCSRHRARRGRNRRNASRVSTIRTSVNMASLIKP